MKLLLLVQVVCILVAKLVTAECSLECPEGYSVASSTAQGKACFQPDQFLYCWLCANDFPSMPWVTDECASEPVEAALDKYTALVAAGGCLLDGKRFDNCPASRDVGGTEMATDMTDEECAQACDDTDFCIAFGMNYQDNEKTYGYCNMQYLDGDKPSVDDHCPTAYEAFDYDALSLPNDTNGLASMRCFVREESEDEVPEVNGFTYVGNGWCKDSVTGSGFDNCEASISTDTNDKVENPISLEECGIACTQTPGCIAFTDSVLHNGDSVCTLQFSNNGRPAVGKTGDRCSDYGYDDYYGVYPPDSVGDAAPQNKCYRLGVEANTDPASCCSGSWDADCYNTQGDWNFQHACRDCAGGPCEMACEFDPVASQWDNARMSSQACASCCRSVSHEVDWNCGQTTLPETTQPVDNFVEKDAMDDCEDDFEITSAEECQQAFEQLFPYSWNLEVRETPVNRLKKGPTGCWVRKKCAQENPKKRWCRPFWNDGSNPKTPAVRNYARKLCKMTPQ